MLMLFHLFMAINANTYVLKCDYSNYDDRLKISIKTSHCLGPILEPPDLPKPIIPDKLNVS